jgi:hypothetical protein
LNSNIPTYCSGIPKTQIRIQMPLPTALAFQEHRFELKYPCLLLWHSDNTDLNSNVPLYFSGIPKAEIATQISPATALAFQKHRFELKYPCLLL